MVKGDITKADLLEMENKINNTQNNYRHEQTKNVQNLVMNMDKKIDEVKEDVGEYKTNNALLNQKMTNIETKVEKVLQAIEGLDNKFATKEEHKQNGERISKLEKGVWWVIGLCATILLTGTITVTIKYIGNTL